MQTGQLVERLKGHKDSVYSVAFTPDGKGLVSGSLDKTLKYWDVRPMLAMAGKIVPGPGSTPNGKKEGGEKSNCMMNFTGHKVRFASSFSPAFVGRSLMVVDLDRTMCFRLLYHTMASGSYRDRRIAGCNSGMRGAPSCS